jgi:hypothetical protein
MQAFRAENDKEFENYTYELYQEPKSYTYSQENKEKL